VDIEFPALFLLGSCIGSFLNVVIIRYVAAFSTPSSPTRFSLGGRSHCPHCGQILRWWELLPLISFIFLRGRCQRCRQDISVQYPIVEGSLGLLTMILATPLPVTPVDGALTVLSVGIAALLVILFMVDLKTMYLPDHFVGILLLAVVLLRVVDYSLLTTHYSLTNAMLGVGIGAGFLLMLWVVTRGRGIGLGDVKLMVPLGILFGPLGTTALLFIAYMSGGLLALYLLFKKKAHLKTALPFGPFLCGAALLLLIFPNLPNQLLALLLGYNPFV
jgi:prepilin signal peptidase PulO-like enzyme (type II secretory pathway)